MGRTDSRLLSCLLVFLALGLLLKFRTERSEICPLTSSAQVRSQGFASWPRDPQAAREMPHRGGGTAGGGKGSSSVSFSQGREASFITKIKAQVGYKEHKVDLDAKRARPSDGNESEGDEGERPDDDAPTIVVLKEGDLTAEEVEAERQKQTKDSEAEEAMPADGKIK